MLKYFNDVIITRSGMDMLNRVISENGRIEFTKMALGKGTTKENIIDLDDIVEPVMDIGVKSSLEKSDTFKVVGTLDNRNVLEAFNLSEIGLYAKDETGKEILYSYTSTDYGEYIPNSDEVKFIREYTFDTAISQSENITIIIDDNSFYVSQKDLKETEERIDARIDNLDSNFQQVEINTKEIEKIKNSLGQDENGELKLKAEKIYVEDTENQFEDNNVENVLQEVGIKVKGTVMEMEELKKKISTTEEVTLWEGSASAQDTELMLVDNLSNYNQFEVHGRFFDGGSTGTQCCFKGITNSTSFKITATNLNDSSNSIIFDVAEVDLGKQAEKILKIILNKSISYEGTTSITGKLRDYATNPSAFLTLTKIIGVRG